MALQEKAVHYWQNSLGKFFPKALNPTVTEINMYAAGYREALRDAIELVYTNKWENMIAGVLDSTVKDILDLGEENSNNN